jgi:hypothetical protein
VLSITTTSGLIPRHHSVKARRPRLKVSNERRSTRTPSSSATMAHVVKGLMHVERNHPFMKGDEFHGPSPLLLR